MFMTEHEIAITLIEVILPIIITLAGLGGFFVLFQRRLTSFRNFIDGLDDALKDGTVTSEELESIWKLIQKLIEQNPEANKQLSNKFSVK